MHSCFLSKCGLTISEDISFQDSSIFFLLPHNNYHNLRQKENRTIKPMISLYYNICIKNNKKIMLLVLKHFF